MAIKIQSTKDLEIDSVKCIVYGGAGVGKTRLCATAPKPIIISAENGLLSLADVDCDYVTVSNMKQFNEAYRDLKDLPQYDSICLDSLSEIAEVLITEILPKHKNAMQAYGELAQAMMPMLRKFRDIKGKHTVFTTKMINVEDEETAKVTQELLMPGRVLPSQIPYMVDELFFMETERKGSSILHTTPGRSFFAKDRSGALDPIEKDLDMTKIIGKIMAKQGQL